MIELFHIVIFFELIEHCLHVGGVLARDRLSESGQPGDVRGFKFYFLFLHAAMDILEMRRLGQNFITLRLSDEIFGPGFECQFHQSVFVSSNAMRRRGFISGSPPPMRAATMISFESLANASARFASMPPLKCLTFAHLLCPAIRCAH